jgi:hypothetical protein
MSASGAVMTELTELRKSGGILSKKIMLGEDGRPKSDGSDCRLTVGKARRHRMNGGDPAGALAAFVNGMNSKTALALGRMTAAAAVDAECQVVSKKHLPDPMSGAPTRDNRIGFQALASRRHSYRRL